MVRTRGELADAIAPAGATTAPAEGGGRKLRAPGLLELEELFSQYRSPRSPYVNAMWSVPAAIGGWSGSPGMPAMAIR